MRCQRTVPKLPMPQRIGQHCTQSDNSAGVSDNTWDNTRSPSSNHGFGLRREMLSIVVTRRSRSNFRIVEQLNADWMRWSTTALRK